MATKTKQKSPAKLRRIVEDFNRRYPVGTDVLLRTDKGEVATCVTRAAEVLGGHSAVAWFMGISGAYSIEDNRVGQPHLFS